MIRSEGSRKTSKKSRDEGGQITEKPSKKGTDERNRATLLCRRRESNSGSAQRKGEPLSRRYKKKRRMIRLVGSRSQSREPPLRLGQKYTLTELSSPPPIPPNWKAALEKEAGQLVHRVPEKMRVGAPEVIEVRLGRAHRDLTVGIMGTGDVSMEELPIVETMTVNLYGSAGAFEIVRQSRETQLVKSSLIWNTTFDQQKFGRWLWHVTPKTTGTYELIVAVSADLSDSRGVSTSEPYRDRMFPISVRVNYGRASARVLKWTVAGAVTGLAGAFTHDVWWPKLKMWLTGAGFLG